MRCAALAAFALLLPIGASAQPRRPAPPPSLPAAAAPAMRFEVGGGVRWSAAVPFDAVAGDETTSGGGSRALFQTSSRLEPATGAEGRFGVQVTPRFAVEGAAAFSSVNLATRVTKDVEGAADITIAEPIRQFVFEGGVLAQLARSRVGRAAPFVEVGAGYLRQLHDGQTFVETGKTYYGGGGVKYLFSPSAGLRAGVRATFSNGGIAFTNGTRVAPSVHASLFWRFGRIRPAPPRLPPPRPRGGRR